MTLKRHKAIESPKGNGVVYRDGSGIAAVRYDLKVHEGDMAAAIFTRDPDNYERPSIGGTITLLKGLHIEYDEPGRFVLELEDGRRLAFVAVGHKVIGLPGSTSDRYWILGTSGWEEVEQVKSSDSNMFRRTIRSDALALGLSGGKSKVAPDGFGRRGEVI